MVCLRPNVQADLGRGGFGRVYKVFDRKLGDTVAIKELTLNDPEAFRAEARILAHLRHEGIVGFRPAFEMVPRGFEPLLPT
jgi:serine/threonine protein kinase